MKARISTMLSIVGLWLSLTAAADSPAQPQITVYFKDAAQHEQSFISLRSFDTTGRVKSANFTFKVSCSDPLCNNYQRDFDRYLLSFRDAIVSDNFYTKEPACADNSDSCAGTTQVAAGQEQADRGRNAVAPSDTQLPGINLDLWLDQATSAAKAGVKPEAELPKITTEKVSNSSVLFTTKDGKIVRVGSLHGEKLVAMAIDEKITADSFDYSAKDVPLEYSQTIFSGMARYGSSLGFAVTTKAVCESNNICVITGTSKS